MKWEEFDTEIRELAGKIDYTPDVIVGVARGGVIPAAILSKLLKVKDMYIVKVRHDENRTVMGDTVPDVSGKKVLLVEDMLETGKSLVVAKEYLERKGAEVKTVSLYTMPITESQPDFSLRQVSEVALFPWE